uniref:Uncharacterized protein n=1 Tax=Hyaloperonospora arabidopsidis (strain Emoy2) TaxID=559515 RepID=M4BZQ7_HYAAE
MALGGVDLAYVRLGSPIYRFKIFGSDRASSPRRSWSPSPFLCLLRPIAVVVF